MYESRQAFHFADGKAESLSKGSPRFDAFRVEKSGGVCWVGTAENLAAARALLRPIALEQSAEQFLVLDQATGARMTVHATDLLSNGTAQQEAAD
jgi:hypothetical protein